MRRRVGAVLGALAIVFALPGVAQARTQAQPTPVEQCRLADPKLNELSGLGADGDRWYATNDGGTKVQVFVIAKDCKTERVVTGPIDPYDVEDMARAQDGTFWLADTGDNDEKRPNVALISLTPQGKTTVYRLTYPDGPHDTEALLLGRDGVPYLVTKDKLGSSNVYRPAGRLAAPGPTPLQHVGALKISSTDTRGGPVPGMFGSIMITGGAVSADGKVVALRTYTDAYLYAAPDGDIAEALRRSPVRVPLPDEPQGEAIAFEPDGALVSASEGTGQPVRVISGAADLANQKAPTANGEAPAPGGASGAPSDSGDKGGLSTLPAIGIVAIVVLVLGLLMSRRRSRG
ncbi:hypothetical protein EV193_11696 [Herbihabitans rhizosphaerae]|uniref:Esterase-like activity of phytase family protein n=1 Tax=Herbihabitans rhizosphaerae TaxID=1872711 RepID=A0A4Q7KD37_9PSEU|nr:hypothetical protein [Herbihabitans rhizosphaerae]RZS30575.1 hypothetical protein EV193_11696 [Herbihabitans rhizosphaerae]